MDVFKQWKNVGLWGTRGLILLSLLRQAILILWAPLRKRTSRAVVLFPLWVAYLLADGVAIFVVGLITKAKLQQKLPVFVHDDLHQSPSTANSGSQDVLAVWAPFLLLHLGGPDTITAFALEDNQLWLRRLLDLLLHSVAVGWVFFLTLSRNKLWLPTLLVYVAGLIKYSERTLSLYLASTSRFQESLLPDRNPGPNYAKFMDEYTNNISAKLPTRIELAGLRRQGFVRSRTTREQYDLSDIEVIKYAHLLFETFKGRIVGLIFSFYERNLSRDFFLERTAKDAFRLAEVELNFFYEILYTKAPVIQGSCGYFLRFISFTSVVAALLLFVMKEEKKELNPTDIGITYALFIGGIALEIIALFMLLSSDWTVVAFTKLQKLSLLNRFFRKLLFVERQRGVEDTSKPSPFHLKLVLPLRRRWSEGINQFNLLHYCLHPPSKGMENVIGLLDLTNIFNRFKYMNTEKFSSGLRDFIFQELRFKSEMAEDLETTMEICLVRGDWVLRTEGCCALLPYVNQGDFDETLLTWHIATELLYATDKGNHHEHDNLRKLAKILSDYMLYLLLMEQIMLSTVEVMGKIRFRDTCAEAKKFFKEKKIGKKSKKEREKKSFFCKHEEACRSILATNTEVRPIDVKGDRSKSVLFDGSILAKELLKLEMEGEKQKWRIISRVWVELLSYVACHCRATTHAVQLSSGGQLVTLVWLLMANLGLGKQFHVNAGNARAKMIVER